MIHALLIALGIMVGVCLCFAGVVFVMYHVLDGLEEFVKSFWYR